MPEVTRIRAADYSIPQLEFITPQLRLRLQNVEYVQANLRHKSPFFCANVIRWRPQSIRQREI